MDPFETWAFEIGDKVNKEDYFATTSLQDILSEHSTEGKKTVLTLWERMTGEITAEQKTATGYWEKPDEWMSFL